MYIAPKIDIGKDTNVCVCIYVYVFVCVFIVCFSAST